MKPLAFRKQLEKEQKNSSLFYYHQLGLKLANTLQIPFNSIDLASLGVFHTEEEVRSALLELAEQIPVVLKILQEQIAIAATNATWFKNDFGDAAPYILKHFDKALENPIAIILLFCSLPTYAATKLYEITEIFIRYAPLNIIEEDVLLNKCGSSYYRCFIERFPKEQMHEFLTNDRKEARVLAKNKLLNNDDD